MQDIFYKIIRRNKEFQGVWEDIVLNYLSNSLVSPIDNQELVEIEICSQRFNFFVILLRVAIRTIRENGYEKDSDEALEIFEKHYYIADTIGDTNESFFTSGAPRYIEDSTPEFIKIRTTLTSDYYSPIRHQITRENEDWQERNKGRRNLFINKDGVNNALTLYLESDIRTREIDRLFLTMLSDIEIISYIEEVGIPAQPLSKDGSRSLLGLDESKLSIEDKALNVLKGFERSWSRSFVKWLSASVVISVVPFFVDSWLDGSGIVIALLSMLFWWFTYLFSYKAHKKILKDVDKLFPITDTIVAMNSFYRIIREGSPLPVSEIKKGMKLLKDANAFMPVSMVAIIEDLEDRKVRWI